MIGRGDGEEREKEGREGERRNHHVYQVLSIIQKIMIFFNLTMKTTQIPTDYPLNVCDQSRYNFCGLCETIRCIDS